MKKYLVLLLLWLFSFAQTVIPAECIMKGKLVGSDITVEGKFEGTIRADYKVDVAENGEVVGTIEATDADIAGIVDGTINIVRDLNLLSTAEVSGSIQCMNLKVETGAIFNGTTKMEVKRKGIKAVEKIEKEKKVAPTPTRVRRRRRR